VQHGHQVRNIIVLTYLSYNTFPITPCINTADRPAGTALLLYMYMLFSNIFGVRQGRGVERNISEFQGAG